MHEIVPEVLEDNKCIFIKVKHPPGNTRTFDIRGDILLIETITNDTQYRTECLLPCMATTDGLQATHDGETLYINLIKEKINV